MDYEQKYKEALSRAKECLKDDSFIAKAYVESIFPELKESEDEQIRKWCISHFKSCINVIKDNDEYKEYLSNKVIHWLEKQGKQKTYGQRKECEDCQFNYAGECKGFCQMKRDEQKPTDKVEPKFHEGEWLCENEPNNYARFIQILETINVQGKERYRISRDIHNDEDIVDFGFVEKYYHKFDIQDAKDGDVLVDVYGNIGIFDKCYDFDWMSSCSLGNNGGFQYFTVEHENEKTYPATKEQRELLFQKMKEEGWEYDNEKKELEKIESKTLNADKVIEWLNDQACQGWIEDVEVDKFVDKFKKDFGL